MNVTIKNLNRGVISFEDPVVLTMNRLEAHRIHGELKELDLHGVSPEFVDMTKQLDIVLKSSKSESEDT